MKEAIVEMKGVEFRYEKSPVLQGINLTIFKDQFTAIFGPNGGGKTTLLKLILGFLKPSKGTLSVCSTTPKAARKKMAYVPQVTRFDKQFPITVMELVLMGSLSKDPWWGGVDPLSKQRAQEALEKVGLVDKQDATFGTLSGGQAQRALIARALACTPELLLLDEPTASVDHDAQQSIYELLMQLRTSITLIMVTHDLQAIINQADRLLCVNKEISEFAPEQLCQHFSLGLYHPF